MILDYIGVKEINGSLIVIDNVENAFYEETVDIRLDDGSMRQGRIVQMDGKRVVIQVFEGSREISLDNTRTRLRGRAMEMPLSPEMLGRVFNGAGDPIDGLGEIYPEQRMNINGAPINPVSRVYPRNYIHTGISSIDTLMTLILVKNCLSSQVPVCSIMSWLFKLPAKLILLMQRAKANLQSYLLRWVLKMTLRTTSAVHLTNPVFCRRLLCS